MKEEMNIPLLLEHFAMPCELSEMILQASIGSYEAEEGVEEAKPGSSVFMFYEQNFGSLSSYSAEELSKWMAELSEELVLKAFQIAYENNKRTIAYAKGILRDWHGKEYTKVSEVKEAAVKFRKKELTALYETEQLLEECEEWKKNVPSEEELQKFLQEEVWRP